MARAREGFSRDSELPDGSGVATTDAPLERSLQLRAESASLGALLERAVWVSAEGVAICRGEVLLWANPAMHAICAVPEGSLNGSSVSELHVFESVEGSDEIGPPTRLDAGLDSVRPRRRALQRADGSAVAVSVSADRLQAVPGGAWVLRVREVATHVRVDEALRTSEARFRALADHAPIGVFLSDVGIRLAFVNARFAQVWGRPAEELVGDRWLEPVLSTDRDRILEAVGDVLGGEDAEVTINVLRPEGDVRTLDVRFVPVVGVDRQASFVGSVEDVTDARAREAELEWQARHDALTGLPNRTHLWEHINRHFTRSSSPVSLLFFDLDDFKLINDSLGHFAGDILLTHVATRLRDAVRADDMVARFGGDEFVVFCPGIGTETDAKQAADRLLRELREPIDLGNRQVRVTASVGVIVGEAGRHDPEMLIRDADVAMYQAKNAGKARAAIFDAAARRMIEHRLDIVSDLRRALAEGEVGVFHQPIVRHEDLHVVGAEALLRYRHRELGPIPANEVIEIAEASGCIDELGHYVLERSCADLAAWRARVVGWRPEYISVNLAASQLSNPDFVSQVEQALATHGLVPQDLCLELTESQLMTDVDVAAEVLGHLAGLGVRLAIDDFGTGYSSLAYLRRFPVSLVKIERSFVADPEEAFVGAIIEAVVAVTRAVGGKVVAEGVETAQQLETVGNLGCSLIQGYLLGRPMPADELPVDPDRSALLEAEGR